MTTFNIDYSLKEEIRSQNSAKNRAIKGFLIAERLLLIATVFFAIIFPIYCIQTGALVSTVTGTGNKSYFLVILFTSVLSGCGLTAFLLLRIARKTMEKVAAGSLVDEKLEIIDGYLYHSFRVKYRTLAHRRHLVTIDLDTVRFAYDSHIKRILIHGLMKEQVVSVNEEVVINDLQSGEYILFDYYSPSLYEYLMNNC